VQTFCGQGGRGFFRCGRPYFFAQKIWTFRNLWCSVRTRGRELNQCGHFADKGGQFFAILCLISYYGSVSSSVLSWCADDPKKNWAFQTKPTTIFMVCIFRLRFTLDRDLFGLEMPIMQMTLHWTFWSITLSSLTWLILFLKQVKYNLGIWLQCTCWTLLSCWCKCSISYIQQLQYYKILFI